MEEINDLTFSGRLLEPLYGDAVAYEKTLIFLFLVSYPAFRLLSIKVREYIFRSKMSILNWSLVRRLSPMTLIVHRNLHSSNKKHQPDLPSRSGCYETRIIHLHAAYKYVDN